jgi:hypothetical protein
MVLTVTRTRERREHQYIIIQNPAQCASVDCDSYCATKYRLIMLATTKLKILFNSPSVMHKLLVLYYAVTYSQSSP